MNSQTHITVRKSSPCGPCLTMGTLVRETARFYVVHDQFRGDFRISKAMVHLEACKCCRVNNPDWQD